MCLETLLEAAMLVCFGVAWPVANLRMLRARRPEGKGMVFTSIILMGYVAGALAKCVSIGPGQPLPGMFWLLIINGASVMFNLMLQWYFGRAIHRRLAGA